MEFIETTKTIKFADTDDDTKNKVTINFARNK